MHRRPKISERNKRKEQASLILHVGFLGGTADWQLAHVTKRLLCVVTWVASPRTTLTPSGQGGAVSRALVSRRVRSGTCSGCWSLIFVWTCSTNLTEKVWTCPAVAHQKWVIKGRAVQLSQDSGQILENFWHCFSSTTLCDEAITKAGWWWRPPSKESKGKQWCHWRQQRLVRNREAHWWYTTSTRAWKVYLGEKQSCWIRHRLHGDQNQERKALRHWANGLGVPVRLCASQAESHTRRGHEDRLLHQPGGYREGKCQGGQSTAEDRRHHWRPGRARTSVRFHRGESLPQAQREDVDVHGGAVQRWTGCRSLQVDIRRRCSWSTRWLETRRKEGLLLQRSHVCYEFGRAVQNTRGVLSGRGTLWVFHLALDGSCRYSAASQRQITARKPSEQGTFGSDSGKFSCVRYVYFLFYFLPVYILQGWPDS